jgi:rhodanese-related sulfurtransferase
VHRVKLGKRNLARKLNLLIFNCVRGGRRFSFGVAWQLIVKAYEMDDISEILNNARQRAQEMNLPYAGALLPAEAYALLQQSPGSKLVDVRTRAEWDFVGRVPGSVAIEWQNYPGSQRNPGFLSELEAQTQKDAIVMFLCRSGARSHAAAAAACEIGYIQSYNILQGFEGDKDALGHRASVGGWQFAGLPWVQS